MTLGFLTACLRDMELPELLKWAPSNGFGAVEIWAEAQEGAAVQSGGINPHALTPADAEQLRNAARESGVAISCLTWCANMLDPRPDVRQARLDHLLSVIRAAGLLDVDVVSCFAGRNLEKSVQGSMEDFKEVFEGVMSAAADHGVRIAVENCPMLGDGFEGLAGNMAYSPPVWRRMFEAFPEMGLNFDPSHLVWMGIDYLRAAAEFAGHIFHTHAKDTELLEDVLADRGILPPGDAARSPGRARPVESLWAERREGVQASPGRHGRVPGQAAGPHARVTSSAPRSAQGGPEAQASPGWWRYRLPGLGVINWSQFVSVLVENGYDGALSIEHEDPVFGGDGDKVRRGLELARRHLEPLIG